MIRVDLEKCNGCGLCCKHCLFGAAVMEQGRPFITDSCVFCGTCKEICPHKAITIDAVSSHSENFEDHTGVWVVMQMDQRLRTPKKVSYELLSEARRLADRLNQKVSAVCFCSMVAEETIKILEEIGCDELFLFENEIFDHYSTEIFTGVLAGLISRHKPSVVLFPATENGRDLAPRIAGRLRIGLTADCTALDLDKENHLIQIRPTYGGNIMASIITPYHRPQMATIRPNVFKIEPSLSKFKLTIKRLQIKVYPRGMRVKLISTKPKITVFKDVAEAEIVIAGGYGIGKEDFKLIHELAVKTGAAVGATRKVVDEGWAPFDIQIGQTGKTIAPDLYIACGISGALQHSIGVKNAKKIIAVNIDPVAPIFSMSDVSILGDAKQILKELNRLADKKGRDALKIR
jgi:electron transfer flavoprotein alpha subunit